MLFSKKFITNFIIVLVLAINCAIINSELIEAYELGQFTNKIHHYKENKPSLQEYEKLRKQFIKAEQERSIGTDIILDDREKLANAIIMSAKKEEIQQGFLNPSTFTPSRHLFEVLDQIKSSKLFQLIKKMPKGGVLHAHDTALCSTDYLMSLTYRSNLWQCFNEHDNSFHFLFSRHQPNISYESCTWKLVKDERRRHGNDVYDKLLRKQFSLFTKNPLAEYKDINDVWSSFMKIFITITPMLTYAPVWKDYYKQALKEFYDDNVHYLEFRGTLPNLYDLDGNQYTQAYTLQIYSDTLEEFKKENPGFFGSKFIYGPNRRVNNATFEDYMRRVVELKKLFPDFIAGFDLVAQEDKGRPLIDYAGFLLQLPDNIKFFFHAGETNWYGTSTDENLIDAILLGTKRIGHGYAIIKHPLVLDFVKEKRIAIEVNPISNQVLKLNIDNRNHPCSYIFANNFPVVISSDDPSFWEVTPLSHDFYIAFLGMASAHSDLRTLKQLAINSIQYSSLNNSEKENLLNLWINSWNEYIDWIINYSEKELYVHVDKQSSILSSHDYYVKNNNNKQ